MLKFNKIYLDLNKTTTFRSCVFFSLFALIWHWQHTFCSLPSIHQWMDSNNNLSAHYIAQNAQLTRYIVTLLFALQRFSCFIYGFFFLRIPCYTVYVHIPQIYPMLNLHALRILLDLLFPMKKKTVRDLNNPNSMNEFYISFSTFQ